jgi:hypothetical protein
MKTRDCTYVDGWLFLIPENQLFGQKIEKGIKSRKGHPQLPDSRLMECLACPSKPRKHHRWHPHIRKYVAENFGNIQA